MKTRKLTTTVLRRTGALGVAAALALSLAACGDDDDTSTDTTGTSAVSDISAEGLSFTDGYVGAKTADTGMTAVFGVLTNTTDEDIHLTGVSGDLAGEYQ
ncbi:MAG: copper chaperone PCu(A)C, partial [Corynebacterium variabile]